MSAENARAHRLPLGLWQCWLAVFLSPLPLVTGSNNIRRMDASLSSPSGTVILPLIPQRQEERRRHSRHLQQERPAWSRHDEVTTAAQVGALYQGYGTHYIDLWCGSPPQRQTVIVDTGSSVTAFPCIGCPDCGVPEYHIDQLFDPNKSGSFDKTVCSSSDTCHTKRSRCSGGQCSLTMAYAEGSRWDAYEAVDQCYVGGPHLNGLVKDNNGNDDLDPKHAKHFAFPLTFGCQTKITGLFKTQLADGIMGMSNNKGTYWEQMYSAGKMGAHKQFALCFSRQPTADREGTEAGAMTLGGVDDRLHHDEMVFTPKASKGRSGFFSVQVRAIYLREGSAGESARSDHTDPKEGLHQIQLNENTLNTGGIIVDSGTTDTYWNRAIASVFKKLFKDLTGKDYGHNAMDLTPKELAALPTIMFQLYGGNDGMFSDPSSVLGLAGDVDPDHPTDVLLAFPPSHYMEFDPETGKYTARFYVTERSGSVLGANAMMGHDVFFDVDGDRIGWAESNCDYTEVLKQNGFTSVLVNDETDDDDAEEPATHRPPHDGDGTDDGLGGSGSCQTTSCRISVSMGGATLLCLLICALRLFCCNGRSSINTQGFGGHKGYERAITNELEMQESGYKDKPQSFDEDDDEDVFQDERPDDEGEFEGDYS